MRGLMGLLRQADGLCICSPAISLLATGFEMKGEHG